MVPAGAQGEQRAELGGGVRLLRAPGAPPVAATAAVPAEGEAETSGRLSLRAKRTRGEDVLSAIAEAEPAFVSVGPPGLSKLSVFAREAPIAQLRRAVLAALHLEEVREDGVRVLRSPTRPGEPGPITASPNGRVFFRARDLAVDEMALAGIGRSGDESVAFVYSPLGEIVALRVGDVLADGAIAAIDANAALVDTAEGPVRISLAVVRAR